MVILLTGATGFLGSSLLKKLINEGFEVICTFRETSDFSRVQAIKNDCLWVESSEVELENIFSDGKIEAIIHCATFYGRNANQFNNVYESNFSFPMMLTKLASKYSVPYFINTDTFFTKEIGASLNFNKKVYMDSYTKSKFIFRETVKCNIEECSFAFINLILEHVYGVDNGKGKFIDFLKNSLVNNVKEIPLSLGSQKRDWIFIDDVVAAYICILRRHSIFKCGEFYNFQVGTGVETSLKEFCIRMKIASKSDAVLKFGAVDMAPNELLDSVANNKDLLKLGWKPITDIEKGIERILRK